MAIACINGHGECTGCGMCTEEPKYEPYYDFRIPEAEVEELAKKMKIDNTDQAVHMLSIALAYINSHSEGIKIADTEEALFVDRIAKEPGCSYYSAYSD